MAVAVNAPAKIHPAVDLDIIIDLSRTSVRAAIREVLRTSVDRRRSWRFDFDQSGRRPHSAKMICIPAPRIAKTGSAGPISKTFASHLEKANHEYP
jgi:hypothetical protein